MISSDCVVGGRSGGGVICVVSCDGLICCVESSVVFNNSGVYSVGCVLLFVLEFLILNRCVCSV